MSTLRATLRLTSLLAFLTVAAAALGQELGSMGMPPAQPSTDRFSEEPLKVGDVVQLTVWNEPELNVQSKITEDGNVIFPFIGPVYARGLTATELEESVEQKYAGGYLVEPQVFITIAQRSSSTVFVLGAVARPGVYSLEGKTTMLELLARCGGALASCSQRIMIIRQSAPALPAGAGAEEPAGSESEQPAGGPLMVDLSALMMGHLEENVVLVDRDVVLFTPSRQASEVVYILGDVETAGGYPLTEDITLARLLASIGLGPKDDKVTLTVVRYSEEGGVVTSKFDVKEIFLAEDGRDFELKSGDVLSIDRESEIYYVIGEVNGPGTFRLQEGLTVREALILAGWITRRGNLNKINVMRKVGLEWQTTQVGLADEVMAGDVIKVEERWF